MKPISGIYAMKTSMNSVVSIKVGEQCELSVVNLLYWRQKCQIFRIFINLQNFSEAFLQIVWQHFPELLVLSIRPSTGMVIHEWLKIMQQLHVQHYQSYSRRRDVTQCIKHYATQLPLSKACCYYYNVPSHWCLLRFV